jgi:class 3 adenylate cyclase
MLHYGATGFALQSPLARTASDMQRVASYCNLLITALGLHIGETTLRGTLVFEQALGSSVLDGWFAHDAKARATRQRSMVEAWLTQLAGIQNATTIVQTIDRWNAALPAGQEVLLTTPAAAGAQKPDILTTLRYSDQCGNGSGMGCWSNPAAWTPMSLALTQLSGTWIGPDYRDLTVAVAYGFSAATQFGVVYQMELASLQPNFRPRAAAAIDAVNADAQNLGLRNVVLGAVVDGSVAVVSNMTTCGDGCLAGATAQIQSSALATAVNGATGVFNGTDFDGQAVTIGYGPAPLSALGLAVRAPMGIFYTNLDTAVGNAFVAVNDGTPGSLELMVAAPVDGTMEWMNPHFFKCNGTVCNEGPDYFTSSRLAAVDCQNGVVDELDYRGVSVISGYACVPAISGGIVVKIDYNEIVADGVAVVTDFVNLKNAEFGASSQELLVVQLREGSTVATSGADVTYLSTFREQGIKKCSADGVCLAGQDVLRALNNQSGFVETFDYTDTPVSSAYSFVSGLNIGIILQINSAELDAPSVHTALELAGCSALSLLVSMVLLWYLSSRLLRSMDNAWEGGKQALQKEKQQFAGVIQNMYPASVAKRLLAGEASIIYNVEFATVFFSDICDFTTVSNGISPEELIRFLGYVYGTMDVVADYYRIYKVKTIGDAYLGVAGLPGTEAVSASQALDTVYFATVCTALFGPRFIHPEEGAILAVTSRVLFGGERTPQQRYRGQTALPVAQANPTADGPPQCVMRVGIATGPVTAGLLQGKAPFFDIWGKTVNLASRLESTGVPGRIQLAESTHSAVMRTKDAPFTFDKRHKVLCKGFGHVSAYFLATSTFAPPKDLLAKLRIEPFQEEFLFQGLVGAIKVSTNSKGSATGSQKDTASKHSSKSSEKSGGAMRIDGSTNHR